MKPGIKALSFLLAFPVSIIVTPSRTSLDVGGVLEGRVVYLNTDTSSKTALAGSPNLVVSVPTEVRAMAAINRFVAVGLSKWNQVT